MIVVAGSWGETRTHRTRQEQIEALLDELAALVDEFERSAVAALDADAVPLARAA